MANLKLKEPEINWIGLGPICPDCRRVVRVVNGRSFEDYARAMIVIWDGILSLSHCGGEGTRSVEHLRVLAGRIAKTADYFERSGVGVGHSLILEKGVSKPKLLNVKVVKNGDIRRKCSKCGSSQVFGFFGRVKGCLGSTCESCYSRGKKRAKK